MSFSDITNGFSNPPVNTEVRGRNVSVKSTSNPERNHQRNTSEKFAINTAFGQLGEQLRDFQRITDIIERKIAEYKSKKISPMQKNELEKITKEARDVMNRLKSQFEIHQRQIDKKDQARTTETAQTRQALSKLMKEYDLLSNRAKILIEEASQIRICQEDSLRNGYFPNPPSLSPLRNSEVIAPPPPPILIHAYKDQDVDQAIVEEREREIRKINRDLVLVNEMFRDVASLVNEQGAMVDQIAVQTDQSHERAQAGLKQVQQAAANQSSCIIA